MIFKNNQDYKSWALSQDWYQSITLSCGIKTNGNIDSEKRIEILKKYNFQNKRVIDIGCNSGLYCLTAKKLGASEVFGIDINEKRLEQARIIAENENYNIKFYNKGIQDICQLGTFDIVICIAVLTEISDILTALENIKRISNDLIILELDIAKPMFYFANPIRFIKSIKNKTPFNLFAEARLSKSGWMISPSLKLIKAIFGQEFEVKNLGKNLRYHLLEIRKVKR